MWIFLALASAVLEGFTSLLRKQSTNGRKDFRLIPILTVGFSFPVVLIFGTFYLLRYPQQFSTKVLLLVFINALLVTVALRFRYKAVKLGDISQIEPLTMLLPAILLLTSWIMLGEKPSLAGAIGVILVALGALYINLVQGKYGLVEPVISLFKKPANRLMLLVVFIWSITANIDKLIVNDLSPPVFVMIMHAFILVLLWSMYRPKIDDLRPLINHKGWQIALAGVFASLAFILQVVAIQTSYVSYVLAIKRLDMLLVVYLGYSVLKEGDFLRRLTGTVIMISGVVLILFFG